VAATRDQVYAIARASLILSGPIPDNRPRRTALLEFLRRIRGVFDRFSTMEVLGVHIDWFFHLLGAALIVFVARRFLPERRVIWLTLALMLGKELVDVFAKTRLEYIRPPTLDLLVDLSSGLLGLCLGVWLARRRYGVAAGGGA
jgi:hypothetical protein